MTFVQIQKPSTGEIVAFSLMAAAYLATTIRTAMMGHARSYYRDSIAIHYLFPLASLISVLENISLAMTGTVIQDPASPWLYVLFALQACIVPILLNVSFEITYLVHKRRSVNFCGLFFDEGKRVKVITTPVRSFVLRNFIRILAVLLLTMGIVANFDLLEDRQNRQINDENAGYAGWYALKPWTGQVHLLLSLLPSMVLIFVSFYLSLVLWRYGTSSSMVVHSSICNPWFSLFFGTLALSAGQCFGETLYTITSNFGYLVYIFSIILLRKEVDKDMAAADDFTEFLEDVARMGNSISVRHSRPTSASTPEDNKPRSPTAGGGDESVTSGGDAARDEDAAAATATNDPSDPPERA